MGRVHWAPPLEPGQIELRRILEAARSGTFAHGAPRRLLRALLRSWRKWEARFVAEFIGDVIGYRNPAARDAIYAAFTDAFNLVAEDLAPADPGTPSTIAGAAPSHSSTAAGASGKAPVTIIAHSLGTVISSDYVWDMINARRAHGEAGFHPRLELANLFTVGSPLALFSLRYGGPAAFSLPISVEHPGGRWINLYDPDDPIGMPLKPLNEAYHRAVFRDVQVDAGPYLLAHSRYFTRSATLALIARKLALDWVALNERLPPGDMSVRYAAYDTELTC